MVEVGRLDFAGESSEGTVVSAYGGFYFVRPEGSDRIVECRSRGRVRFSAKQGQRVILVGDRVQVSTRGEQGVIEMALPRSTELLRPPVANVDLAIVVVAAANPAPNRLFTDRVLVSVERAGVEALVCVNKVDLSEQEASSALADYFGRSGYETLLTSAKRGEGIGRLRDALSGRTSTFAGASGVGKSALINAVMPGSGRHTGELSEKLRRGRHTTRHTELLTLPNGGFVVDTPGFTSLDVTAIPPRDLGAYFPEIAQLAGACRFNGCLHEKEPDCAVKEAVQSGGIHGERYQHYLVMLAEAREHRLW